MKRWVFLFFSCAALFGAQMISDETAILATRLSGTSPGCYQNTGTDYGCLSMSATEFNALYVIHFWAGAVCALCTGFLTARYGVWVMSLATGGSLLVGMIFFTLGPYCETTEAAFALMMVGKLIYGCGYWGNIVVSQQAKSHWFFGKELAVSFALYTNSIRVSAIVTYASVGTIVQTVGLQHTMWIVFIVALTGPLGAVIAGWIYREHAESSMEASVYRESLVYAKGLDFSVAKRLNRYFWTLGLYLFLFYGAIIMVLADFPKFLAEARGETEAVAGLITGIVVDVGILSPLLGIITDLYGAGEKSSCS
ncbi:hypothetical protein RvY_04197-2 [Ramazzottius varieornatus]|uniref:Lysosomal dipeptide transporter MFSD1 n=1 Tax=Ramazzottius varieornatus TaxID=947166 RepID=A0A1D1V021_RAMVA|nr:hypothetical protein RvY_04197-2 [Ramazzottius varieornatus]